MSRLLRRSAAARDPETTAKHRTKVLAALRQNAGAQTAKIARAAGVPDDAARRHLAKLELDGLVEWREPYWWPVEFKTQDELV